MWSVRFVVPDRQGGHMVGRGHIMALREGEVYMWVVVVVVIGVLGYILIQDFRSERPPGTPDDAPVEILKKRYARGEITKDKYEEMRRSF